jgi:hypothetical protein
MRGCECVTPVAIELPMHVRRTGHVSQSRDARATGRFVAGAREPS